MNNINIQKYKHIVQYFWDPEPRNDQEPDAPIWCLGREYSRNFPLYTTKKGLAGPQQSMRCADNELRETDTSTAPPVHGLSAHGWPEAFLDDFESKIWVTYRSNFVTILKSEEPDATSTMTLGVRLRNQFMDSQGFTSDTGWGCMIRSGQSLLANTLSILLLGRDWRRGSEFEEEAKLLSLFADYPDAPFSIHRFVKHGYESCGKYPGEWFGPSATARCIEALSIECENPMLRVYVTNDNSDVYEDRFLQIARSDSGRVNPTLILIGTRLGIDHITPLYWEALKATLQYPQSVGIAGGRPSASHYFVGVQGSFLFYLDPHHTRPALCYTPDEPYSKEQVDSYHTRRVRRIHIKDMDPSMLIGFLIKDEDDWTDWKRRVMSTEGKPIVHVLGSEMQPDFGQGRKEALDEVEALDDFEDSLE